MIKDKKLNIYLIILITAVLHAAAEGVIVFALTPLIVPGQLATSAAVIALSGTFVHHLLDCAITAPIAIALGRAKVIPKLTSTIKTRR